MTNLEFPPEKRASSHQSCRENDVFTVQITRCQGEALLKLLRREFAAFAEAELSEPCDDSLFPQIEPFDDMDLTELMPIADDLRTLNEQWHLK